MTRSRRAPDYVQGADQLPRETDLAIVSLVGGQGAGDFNVALQVLLCFGAAGAGVGLAQGEERLWAGGIGGGGGFEGLVDIRGEFVLFARSEGGGEIGVDRAGVL